MSIILPQTTIVKWHVNNKEHYESKGYIFTKVRDEFEVNVLDLSPGYGIKIKCICDYCGLEILKFFGHVNPNRLYTYDSELKVCCNNCKNKKAEDIFQEKYGERNIFKCNKTKEKRKNTMIERYGTEVPLQNECIKNKLEQTNLKKYGAENPAKNQKIKDKVQQTCLEKYGVDHYSKTEEYKEKYINTMIEKYNITNPMQNEDMKEKAITNMLNAIYKNGTGPCSKQQKHIHNLIGGELNYPAEYYLLDIAFPEEMIYIEYDGGGHDLSIKFGQVTQKEFNQKEYNRYNVLRNSNWKFIRIISREDKMLFDEQFINIINKCKQYLLNSNHSWIEINIDKMKIICSEYIKDIL